MGLELNVVAIALFGGISIFGGRGTIIGVVLAVCVFGSLQASLTAINVSAQAQNIVTGCLLLVSVLLPNLTQSFSGTKRKLQRRKVVGT